MKSVNLVKLILWDAKNYPDVPDGWFSKSVGLYFMYPVGKELVENLRLVSKNTQKMIGCFLCCQFREGEATVFN